MAQSKKITKECKQCSALFNIYPSWVKQRNGAPFCSVSCRAESTKGIPVNVGHAVSETTREKIRTARANQPEPMLGKKHSTEARAKMRMARLGKYAGDNSPSWKGGITTANRLERARFRREVQKKIFRRDNWTCQICNIHDVNLHVDHIKSWADYPTLRFEMDNCRTLCIPCHYYVTFKRKMPQGYKWGTNYRQQRSIS